MMFARTLTLITGVLVGFAALAKTERDIEYKNPKDGKTYGFIECEWKKAPNVRERAGKGGMTHSVQNGVARCQPEGGVRTYPIQPDYTDIENVRCEGTSEQVRDVHYCLRHHQGRLEAHEGYFSFVTAEPESETAARSPAKRGGGSN